MNSLKMEFTSIINHCVYKYAYKPYLKKYREDYIQEANIAAIKAKKSYDKTKNTKLTTHIYNNAKYSVLNYNRYNKKHTPIDLFCEYMFIESNFIEEYIPYHILSNRELLIFNYYFVEEFSIKEICEYTHLSNSTIYSHISNIKRKLREYFHQFNAGNLY